MSSCKPMCQEIMQLGHLPWDSFRYCRSFKSDTSERDLVSQIKYQEKYALSQIC